LLSQNAGDNATSLDSLGAFTLRCLSKIAHSETGGGCACRLRNKLVGLTGIGRYRFEDLLQVLPSGFGPLPSSVYITTCPQLAKAAVQTADEGRVLTRSGPRWRDGFATHPLRLRGLFANPFAFMTATVAGDNKN
jgi:hypothetical protein